MHIRQLVTLTAGLLSACAVGTDFQRPAGPSAAQYTRTQPAATAAAAGDAGAAQRFVSGGSAPGSWWELFQCAALDTLVDDALAHSPTVLEAQARLRAAREALTAQTRGSYFPAVDAQLGATRERVNPAAFGIANVPNEPPFTLYNAQVNVTYRLDVFGAERRAVEAVRAHTEYQEYETQLSRLSLAANVVAAAIRQADLEAQLDFTGRLLKSQGRQLAISEERYRAGGIALEQLNEERSRIEQLHASLASLTAARAQIDDQLAVYTGKAPAEAAVPRFALNDLKLPAELPLTLPAELVRRRPDVQAAEALWHEAGANVGVATADLFPRLTLSGSAGSQRTHAADLVDGVNVWSVGATLLQPIFHAGELRARRRSAVATYAAAAQTYEQTVLESLQQVADSLQALDADATGLGARARALEQSSDGYGIARQRFAAGGISESALLDKEQLYLQSGLDRSRAAAQRFSDTAALLKALAGPF